MIVRFPVEQPFFAVEAGGIAGQAAVGADDAVTGHDDRDGVVAHGAAYRLGGHPAEATVGGQPRGNRAVCHRGSIGNLPKNLPDRQPERRPLRGQRRRKIGHISLEIAFEPATRLVKHRQPAHNDISGRGRGWGEPLPFEPKPGEHLSVPRHPHSPQGGVIMPN